MSIVKQIRPAKKETMLKIFEKIRYRIVKYRTSKILNARMLRGILASSMRNLDYTKPQTWEFSCFSQNGEDGIIDVLTSRVQDPNKYFIEIGAHNGLENCSSYLSLVKKYSGIMVEGSRRFSRESQILMSGLNDGVKSLQLFVTLKNINKLVEASLHKKPDLFIIDIDGNDYYLVKSILENGIKPAIFVVEYNSTYGPSRKVTIKYDENFLYSKAHPSQLYYGASIAAWKDLFCQQDYQFISVDSSGVNAFFVDKSRFDANFLESIRGCDFTENLFELRKFKLPHHERFDLIKEQDFFEISQT
jgi:hypothetical protein